MAILVESSNSTNPGRHYRITARVTAAGEGRQQVTIFQYSAEQQAVTAAPLDRRIFLEGPAGCGKTTCGAARLARLLDEGACGSEVLVLTPQRSLARPYLSSLDAGRLVDGSPVETLTFGGLARRMVELFWPEAAADSGFTHPDRAPRFLTMETAGYYMAQLVSPLLAKGYFESLVIDPNRLFSQILDTLNKAALGGFPHTEIGTRLASAWAGDSAQKNVYAQAQECAVLFRKFCLENCLLDYSLQAEIFFQRLWPDPLCRGYLTSRYRHLVFDNIEEDAPLAHDLALQWLADLDSAFFICDHEGGYRLFLGADPSGAGRLKEACDMDFLLNRPMITPPEMVQLSTLVAAITTKQPGGYRRTLPSQGRRLTCLAVNHQRYYPQMLDYAASEVAQLVQKQGVPAEEIAILSPFVSDSLRFSLEYRLFRLGVPMRTHRPSHGLKDEPAVRCMLTLAAIAHPDWRPQPTNGDLIPCLMQSIHGLDMVRASLLVNQATRTPGRLGPLESMDSRIRERITSKYCLAYERLRAWLEERRSQPAMDLDVFFSRLFGEVLSQPGFGFHESVDAGTAAARLIESMRQFRWAACGDKTPYEQGSAFVEMVRRGIIAAQYYNASLAENMSGVLLTPATGFLMENQACAYQFWLDCGSLGWWERLDQPLTHPYVLSQRWPAGRIWSDADEYSANQETLSRLLQGLIHRCTAQITICYAELSEGGYDQQGPLLRLVQDLLRSQGGFAWSEASRA